MFIHYLSIIDINAVDNWASAAAAESLGLFIHL